MGSMLDEHEEPILKEVDVNRIRTFVEKMTGRACSMRIFMEICKVLYVEMKK